MNLLLKETRKYGLSLRFTSQNIIYGKGQPELRKNLLANTNVKITGRNGIVTLKVLAAEMGISIHELSRLNFHQFYCAYGAYKKKKVRVKHVLGKYSALLQKRGDILSQTHRLVKSSGYYKPIVPNSIQPEDWIHDVPTDMQDKIL